MPILSNTQVGGVDVGMVATHQSDIDAAFADLEHLLSEERETLKKEGKVKAGQDVHHKNGDPTDNRRSNIEATSRKYNRSRNKK